MTCSKKIEELGKEFGVSDSDKSVPTPMGKDFVPTRKAYQTTEEGQGEFGTPRESENDSVSFWAPCCIWAIQLYQI
jgi:hypothetical protein